MVKDTTFYDLLGVIYHLPNQTVNLEANVELS